MAKLKLELKSKTHLAESVVHKAHRRWDRVEHPAYGLMDNASQNLILVLDLNTLTSKSRGFKYDQKVQGRVGHKRRGS